MYKLIIILIILFSTHATADITQKELDDYMAVSRGGAYFEYFQEKILYTCLEKYDLDLELTPSSVLKSIRKELNNKKYIAQYTKKFKKLDTDTYYHIMKFYGTMVGKKYAEMTKKVTDVQKYKTRAHALESFRLSQEKSPYSIQKIELIHQVMKKLDTVALFMEYSIEMAIYKHYTLPMKYGTSDTKVKLPNEIREMAHNIQKTYIMHQELTDMILFQDFTEEELEEILKYASSNAGKLEYRLLVTGIFPYYSSIMNDIMDGTFNPLRSNKQ